MHGKLRLLLCRIVTTTLVVSLVFPASLVRAVELTDDVQVDMDASPESPSPDEDSSVTGDLSTGLTEPEDGDSSSEATSEEQAVSRSSEKAKDEPADANSAIAMEPAGFFDTFRGTSFRYSDGEPLNGGSATARSGSALVSWTKKDNVYYASNGATVNGAVAMGIDVSTFNGDIDWAKVKASGIDYVIVRCGYGWGGSDDKFVSNIKGAQAAGLKIGVYLYSYAWNASVAKDEASWTISQLKKAGLTGENMDLPVYYDMENTDRNGNPAGVDGNNVYQPIQGTATFTSIATTYCDAIQAAGYKAGIYANLNWWNNYLTDASLDKYSRWVAQYNVTCDYTGVYDHWQRTSSGTVAGIAGAVDIDFQFTALRGLITEGDKIRFVEENGTYYSGGWKTVNGKKYYFDKDGYALRYSQTIGGKAYYFNSQCVMQTGWVTWNADGRRSYFAADGAALEGWQTISGKRYYFDPADRCRKALRYSQTIGGKAYYFNSQGAMHTGLLRWVADGTCSYYDSDGHPVSGWKTVNGKRYYFNPSDVDHKALRYSQTIGGKAYYFNSQCVMQTGWVTWNADGRRSYFAADGAALEGWQTISGKRYYFDPADRCRKALRYSQTIGGKAYYFNSQCVMQTGWLQWNSGGMWSYFNSDGVQLFGKQTIGGKTYDFGTSGKSSDCPDELKAYIGFQNPKQYYQVSHRSVSIKNQGKNQFGYCTPSQIKYNATRNDCVNAMITRAYDYVGTRYMWDYSCAPGVGVDCSGLVMQCLYATGMDLSPMNPWDHYYTAGHDQYANQMWNSSKFKHVKLSERKRGDLICYPGHIAIYIGDDTVIEATGNKVRIANMRACGLSIRGVIRPFVD